MKYTNVGSLFHRQKKNDKSPDMGGDLLLTQEMLDSCPRDEDGDIKIEVGAWIRQGAKGEFLSLRLSKPYAPANPTQTAAPKPTFKKQEVVEDEIPDPWA